MESTSKVFIHAIISTAAQKPWLTEQWRTLAYRLIKEQLQKMDSPVVAMGGTDNHVHVIFRMSPDYSLDELVKRTKLSSECELRHSLPTFMWENGYTAFTIGEEEIETQQISLAAEAQKHLRISHEEELEELHNELQMEQSNPLTDIDEHKYN